MKKLSILAATFLTVTGSVTLYGQSALDAMSVTQRDFKGTARFMSMGGAFTALGGDLSSISLNPAGIGVYRSSEVAVTLGLDLKSNDVKSQTSSLNTTQTKFNCNNFGYVGTIKLGSTLETLSWGVNYNRVNSFDRKLNGRALNVGTSLTDYMAALAQGVCAVDMEFGKGYNPYFDSNIDWLSILGYNSFVINNINGTSDQYISLLPNGQTCSNEISVNEKGYVDNYEITFGGNFSNKLSWGIGIGINDMHYVRQTIYNESFNKANVYANNYAGIESGTAQYRLKSEKSINGTGWNLSFGLIYKPIQEIRIGAAIHSPTWYTLDISNGGVLASSFSPDNRPADQRDPAQTDVYYDTWKLASPWKFNLGVAGVIADKLILSADYELQSYCDNTIQTMQYDNWGPEGYTSDNYFNKQLKEYTKTSSTIRFGAEYRITSKFSARVGYNTRLSAVNNKYQDNAKPMYTADTDTDTSFSLEKTTNNICAGLGYRFGNFYADLAYVHTMASSTLHPFSSYDVYTSQNADSRLRISSPAYNVSENNNSIVLSVGYKF